VEISTRFPCRASHATWMAAIVSEHSVVQACRSISWISVMRICIVGARAPLLWQRAGPLLDGRMV